jgi:hypothetical protein
MSTEQILAERGKTHGVFRTHANISQSLKEIMRSMPGWERLTHSQREALDMIQHKIGRILNGNPNHADHWDDIAGYSTLVSKELAPADAAQ